MDTGTDNLSEQFAISDNKGVGNAKETAFRLKSWYEKKLHPPPQAPFLNRLLGWLCVFGFWCVPMSMLLTEVKNYSPAVAGEEYDLATWLIVIFVACVLVPETNQERTRRVIQLVIAPCFRR